MHDTTQHNTTQVAVFLPQSHSVPLSPPQDMSATPQESGEPTRKRKSNFDVPPALAAGAEAPTGDSAAASKLAQAKAIAALLAAAPGTNSSVSGSESLTVPVNAQQSYQRDEIYYARLERAREKNINYIKRKDLEILQRKARGEYEEPDLYFSSSKAPKQPRGNSHMKSGLGSSSYGHRQASSVQQQYHKSTTNENTSIYVAGLSPDLTEQDLETLFSINGKIKRIKIYTFPDGRKKGDALVTFVKVEAVALACLQYNNVDIGGGFILEVTRASFKTSSDPTPPQQKQQDSWTGDMESTTGEGGEFLGMMQTQEHQGGLGYNQNTPASAPTSTVAFTSSSVSSIRPGIDGTGAVEGHVFSAPLTEEQLICEALPAESEVYEYPVALIENVYDRRIYSRLDSEFFVELEADMLEACCSCGRVRRIITPEHPSLLGTVAVTFEDTLGAQECFVKLHRRWFDSRQLSVRLFQHPPRPHAQPFYTSNQPKPFPAIETATTTSTNAESIAMSNFLSSMQESYGEQSDEDRDERASITHKGEGRPTHHNDTTSNNNNYHGDNRNNSSTSSCGDLHVEAAVEAAQDTEDFLNSLL